MPANIQSTQTVWADCLVSEYIDLDVFIRSSIVYTGFFADIVLQYLFIGCNPHKIFLGNHSQYRTVIQPAVQRHIFKSSPVLVRPENPAQRRYQPQAAFRIQTNMQNFFLL